MHSFVCISVCVWLSVSATCSLVKYEGGVVCKRTEGAWSGSMFQKYGIDPRRRCGLWLTGSSLLPPPPAKAEIRHPSPNS